MKKPRGFEQTVAIVTGGGQGIGLCIAQTFLRAGASVVVAEYDATLKVKAETFLDAGDKLLFIQTDVSSEESVKAMAAKTLERFGRIDFLIHNAAIFDASSSLEALSHTEWRRVIDTNLSGAFLCARYCQSQLERSGGAIVHIASTRAIMSEPNTLIAYSASKGGLVALTHALANTLGPAVRVNCISPGWVVTDVYQHGAVHTELTDPDHAQHPAGRVGQPEDIAEMALYLCSDKAGFITGQNFVIDGGITKKMIYS